MINTIIFDLDGTLLNTLEGLKNSTNFALKKFNCPEITLEQTRSFVGNGVRKLIERAIPNGEKNPDFEKCLNTFKEHYSKTMYQKTVAYDGIEDMLTELKKRGIKTGVVSNKFDTAVKELCKNYFDGLIIVAIGESPDVRKKPAPDSVLKAMEILGAKPENTLYVGDSDVDIQTAKNTNLKSVGVTWGFRDRELLEEEGADFIINTPCELLELI
ncbi:MAG TPA: HAD family hydrolase [Candidatus Adamsella sp.]|nr:HAD family hydrolase [Candidatus Adamsella sp.]